jgi:hypothetical protein
MMGWPSRVYLGSDFQIDWQVDFRDSGEPGTTPAALASPVRLNSVGQQLQGASTRSHAINK